MSFVLNTQGRSKLHEDFRRWLEERYTPIAGAETPPADDPPADDPPADDPPADDPPADDPPADDPPEGDEDVTLTKAEYEQMRKENAAFKKKAAETERKRKQDERKRALEEGRHEELAQEAQREAQEAVEAREAAEYELDRHIRSSRVISIATTMGFRDPRDAILHLSDDDTGEDKTCELALRKLAKEKKYLLDERKATGGPGGSSGNGDGSITMEDVKNMTEAEVNKRWPEVQEAMKAEAAQAAGRQ